MIYEVMASCCQLSLRIKIGTTILNQNPSSNWQNGINDKFDSSNTQEKSKDETGVTLVNFLFMGTTVNSDQYIKH
jgi:hypothetical protein